MEDNKKFIGKEIKVSPLEPPQTDIDVNKSLENAILSAASSDDLKTDAFKAFSTAAQTREAEYELIDTMAQDSTIAAALETYAEDISQPNSKGDIFWAESDDADVAGYVNYLLKKINVDKHAFSWAYQLVKYGDVYLHLLRNSDFENSRLFNKGGKQNLNEDVNLNIAKDNDHYALNVEMMKNPNEMFELTKFGKSMAYIKAATSVQGDFSTYNDVSYFTHYNFKNNDVDIYAPTEFVHACLEGSTSRSEEELDIFFNDDDYSNKQNGETFQVRRGTGILNDLFKVWRQLTLLENSVLLNRLTRSSVVRAIQVEVGDMPVNQVSNVTSKIKNLIENKASLDVGKNMTEFTNPGPVENVIIVPTRNGKGTLTVNQIGGEVDPKQLTDLDWYNNKLFGGLKIPKQYFGWTDDAGGFSAGTSLSQYSARYGKAVKRMQASLIEMVTDMINLILIDLGYPRYINAFTIKMQAPITQEEIDKKADLSNTLRNVSDIMSTLTDVSTTSAKLKVLKSLLAQCLDDQDIIDILSSEIEKLEKAENDESSSQTTAETAPVTNNTDMSESSGFPSRGGSEDLEQPVEFTSGETSTETPNESAEPTPEEPLAEPEGTETPTTGVDDNLPSFADLGVDGTTNQ